MTDTSINKAAERLRRLVAEHPMYEGDVDAALATERRNTVELIRAELDGARRHGGMIARADVAAILDETEVAP